MTAAVIASADEALAVAAAGLYAITVPAQWGGADVAPSVVAEVLRLLAYADPNIAQIPHSHFVYVQLLKLAASEGQQRFFFGELLAGKRFANAQSERGSKTVADISTWFTPDGEAGYRLDGTKYYCTGTLFAHWIPVLARLHDPDRTSGLAAGDYVLYVPADSPGLAVVDDWNALGQRLTGSGTVTLEGKHIHVKGAQLGRQPTPTPPVFFGGSSGPAGPVAAKYADTYLTWGEPPSAVSRKLEWIRGLAVDNGRKLEYGLRIHVISRDTSAQAWAEADRLLAAIDPAAVARVQENLARSESEGQRRTRELHGGDTDRLEIGPNLWAGVGLVRGGAGTALVGSHEEVADRLVEYANLGISHFILSGYPHLEEAYWFGEGVLPILERRRLWRHPHGRSSGNSSAVPFAAASTS